MTRGPYRGNCSRDPVDMMWRALGTGGNQVTEPGITVVTPVWGEYARFLPKLADALEPFFLECERSIGTGKMLVVDNHSEDPIKAPTSRCEVIRTGERLSVGAARNRGLERVENLRRRLRRR